MNDHKDKLEEIYTTLKNLREKPGFRKKFPRKVWESIIQLAKTLSFHEVCQRLKIHPAYLKRKIKQLNEKTSSDPLDFQELSYRIQNPLLIDTVVIELTSHSGLKARIEGPSTCLKHLSSLFRGE
ncbi:MAG: hypothetical protein KDK40_01590 [Chlamydiia bacterium]|nr:hypothetical protein [Chlamydiia bacterium]